MAIAQPKTDELVRLLTRWAEHTPWVVWLELSGSLGRGAGDERSDVDAGIGVLATDRLDEVADAVGAFAPVAESLREPFGTDMTHLITVYRDGRQLSLVVMPAQARTGLPPEAVALVDKSGNLQHPIEPSVWDPDEATRRRWTFLACLTASDALKHSVRGNRWRALRSLNEARDLHLQLVAAQEGVTFPQFGAVSLENAGRPVPVALAQTLPPDLEPDSLGAAVRALVIELKPFIESHDLDGLVEALGLAD